MSKIIADLSHWQTVTDWDKLKDVFIIHKVTQGTGYLDTTYKERKDKINASYHFADGGDPVKEAEWFVKNSNEPVLVLDWEIEHATPVEWCTKFIKVVEQMTGKDCWLYTNDSRALKYDFPEKWTKWIARYKDYTGDLDYNYQPKADWDLWQYTSRGRLDGVEGNVDLNVPKIDLDKLLPNDSANEEESAQKEEETVDNTNETIPAPVEAVDGDDVEIVEEDVETPPASSGEATDESTEGLKYDWEKQEWVMELSWVRRLINVIINKLNKWIK